MKIALAESNKNLNKEISIDKYDLEKTWLERIAPKYLDVDNINHLKVGLYGYINEVMGTSIRYATSHRNFLYDEAFLNTASLTKSIYNKAKSYNYEIPMAKPAVMDITFTITQKDIMAHGDKQLEGGAYTYTLRLSADDKYYCGKISFMSENDIVIKATRMVDGSYSYAAQYDRSKVKDGKGLFSNSTIPYIPIWVNRADGINNTDVITIQYTVYQVNKIEKLYENYSSNLSDNLYFTQEFKDNLANFTVRYKTQIVDSYLTPYFNDTFTPEDSYYCYYNFSNNELNVFFSALPGNFKPVINSKLYITTYTTLGAASNFTYSGEVLHQFSNQNLNRLITDKTVIKISDPHGGTNMPTKGEVKQALIYEFLTRNNLITEFDLNTFFNSIVNDQIIESSKVLFVKKRDDILKRTFVGYTLLRDQTGLIIPSNTIDLSCKNFNINEEFHIPSGSLITYKDGKYTLVDNEVSLNDGNFKYYEGLPNYFRKDSFTFMEVKDKVANNLENLIFDNGEKRYILYKNSEKTPSHIRYRNNYLRYVDSIADLNIINPASTKLCLRVTNDIAERLENIDENERIFIIYTFTNNGTITSYNREENRNEYIRYTDSVARIIDNAVDNEELSSVSIERFLPIEDKANVNDTAAYLNVVSNDVKAALQIKSTNSYYLTKMDDGNFYLVFDNYNDFLSNDRFINFEQELHYQYYEDVNLNIQYTDNFFLHEYGFSPIFIYNFSDAPNRNFIISESPENGKYYREFELQLDANYLYKKLYLWFKDEEFRALINSVGGYEKDNRGDEVYISYNFSPPRTMIRYREEYETVYFRNNDSANDIGFRDLDDVVFIDKPSNSVMLQNAPFIKKDILDTTLFSENELIVYNHPDLTGNIEEFVIYNETDTRMSVPLNNMNENIYYFVPYELQRYFEIDDYVNSLKDSLLITYEDSDIYTINGEKKYLAYKEDYQLYKDDPDTSEELFKFYNDSGLLTNEDYEMINDNEITENDLIYRLPYALQYSKEPYSRVLAIQNTLDKNLYFNFKEINNTIVPSEFVLNNIKIERNAITYDRVISDSTSIDTISGNKKHITVSTDGFVESTMELEYDDKNDSGLADGYYELDEATNRYIARPKYTYKIVNDINKYFLSFNLNTTLFANIRTTMEEIKANELNVRHYTFNTDAEYYKYCKEQKVLIARCLLKDTYGQYLGYFDFDNESFSNLKFTYTLTTDNKLSSRSIDVDNTRKITTLHFINCIRGLTGETLPIAYLPEKVTMELCFLVKVLRDRNNKPYYSNNTINTLKDPLNLSTYFQDYACVIRMESNTSFSFFRVISDIINPLLDVKNLQIKELPVIGKHYLYNYNVFKNFFNTFDAYYDILKENFDKLENNTSLNLKFYNTYGPSNYYRNNKNDTVINTDINMELSVMLIKDTYTQELDFKIKNFILDFVEKVNESHSNVFAISNLIRELEKNFEEIEYIEFETLNGQELEASKNQIIHYNHPSIKDMTKEQLIKYVPEYLNVHVNKNAYIQGPENFDVGITITYK